MNNNYFIQFMVYGALGFIILLAAIVVLLIMQNKRRYVYQAEIKEKEYQYQHDLLNTRIEMQEQLLQQVSQEIHDNVGQVLSLVKVHLYSAGSQIENHSAINLLNTSAILLDKAIEDLRNISHAKSIGILEQLGLSETIKKELGYISNSKNITTNILIEGAFFALLPEQELFIYRIAQEAINNSLKHSGCSEINVWVIYEPALFILTISDNGVGFVQEQKQELTGIGISNMKQRAKLLNASLSVTSANLSGTTITLKMPVNGNK